MGIGSNPNDKDRTDNVPHTYKKATKPSQIKSSKDMAGKPEKAKKDPLLGDPIDKPKRILKIISPKALQRIEPRMMYKYTNLYFKDFPTLQIWKVLMKRD